jgi:GAF domain-containing protein
VAAKAKRGDIPAEDIRAGRRASSAGTDDVPRSSSERAAARNARTLAKINEILLSAVGPEEVLSRLVGEVSEVAGADKCLVIETSSGRYTITHVRNVPDDLVGKPKRASFFPAFQLVAQGRVPVLIDDAWNDPRTNKSFVKPNGLRALQLIPLVVGDDVVALLALVNDTPQEFGRADMEFCESMAVAMSLALRNARLFEAEVEARRQAKRELERTELLQEVTATATASLSLSEIGGRVLAVAAEHLGASAASIYAFDESEGVLRALAIVGYPEDVAAQIRIVAVDDGSSVGHLVLHHLPLVTHESGWIPPASEQRLQRMDAGTKRWVALSIGKGRRDLGVLALVFDGNRTFGDDELSLYRSVANLLGAAFENARLFESENVRSTRLQALQAVAALITSSLDRAEAITRGLEEAARLLDVAATSLWVVSPERDKLQLVGSLGFPDQFLRDFEDGLALDAPHDVVKAFNSGKPVVHADARASNVAVPVREAYARYGIELGSLVALPLQSRAGRIGGLTLAWRQPRPFAPDDIAYDLSLAGTFAIALENARMFDAEQKARRVEADRAARLSALREIAEAASSSLDLHAVASLVVDSVHRLLAAQQVQIRLVSADGKLLESEAVIDLPGGVLERIGPMPVNADMETAACFRSREPRIVGDLRAARIAEGSAPNIREAGVRSAVLMPLVAGDEAVGTFYVAWAEPRSFGPEETAFYESVAAQFVAGLQNARLYEQAQRHSEFARVLAETAATLAATLDLGRVAGDVLATAAGALGATDALLSVRADGGWRTVAACGPDADEFEDFRADAVAQTMARIFETREPFFASDVEATDHVDRELARRLGYKSFIAFPVLHRDEVTGVVAFSYDRAKEPLGDEEMGFLTRLAFMIGVAEENTRLYQNAHRIAETLQEALIAMPAQVRGVEFAHAYRSATEAERVGGDFYDVFELSQDHVGLTIGDVAGKGISAAVLTSLVKYTIRAHATEKGKTPSDVLALTNEVVLKATPTESFVTVFFGILDCRDGRLVYSNAGHTTAALVERDGIVARLGVTGPLLGAFPNVAFGQSETRLDFEELLFLYTDGLTEARRHGEFYGQERLFELLGGLSEGSAADVVGTVTQAVTVYSDNLRRDDMAILAVRRAPDAQQALRQLKLHV